jgi:hypothetical protein
MSARDHDWDAAQPDDDSEQNVTDVVHPSPGASVGSSVKRRSPSVPAANVAKTGRAPISAVQLLMNRGPARKLARTSRGTSSRSASESAPEGDNSKPAAWYYEHWQPSSESLEAGMSNNLRTDKALRAQLAQSNCKMQCKHCSGYNKSWGPTTNFRDHLIRHCHEFRESDAWKSAEVQDAVDKALKKDADTDSKVRPFSAHMSCHFLSFNRIEHSRHLTRVRRSLLGNCGVIIPSQLVEDHLHDCRRGKTSSGQTCQQSSR